MDRDIAAPHFKAVGERAAAVDMQVHAGADTLACQPNLDGTAQWDVKGRVLDPCEKTQSAGTADQADVNSRELGERLDKAG